MPGDVDARDESLWRAIEHDDPDGLRLLLAGGVAPRYHDPSGWSPLHHAVDVECDSLNQVGRATDLRLIRPLLDAGADPDARYSPGDREAETPLDLAVSYGNAIAIDALVAVGARSARGESTP